MDSRHTGEKIKRRTFLYTTATAAASAMVAGFGSSTLFAAGNGVQSTTTVPTIPLNNGITMPMLGYGTMTIEGASGERCVADAISVGYRLLDTATIYGNEATVGAGIVLSGIQREELFVTTKLWVDDSGYANATKAFERSLNKLRMEYVDLYLIHRPRGDVKGSWKAMEELYKQGKIKAIGVSNFDSHQLDELIATSSIKPVINQIETHAFFQQHTAEKTLKHDGVQMEGWSPFAEGRNGLFTNKTIATIGAKYNKSNAQVSLRWLLQRGIIAIPRTSQKAHMLENFNIFDFELDGSDLQTLAALDLNRTQFPEWN